MADRRFKTLALRDSLRGCTIRCGTGHVSIDPFGETGPVNQQTAEALLHLGGFQELFDEPHADGAPVLHPADEETLAAGPAEVIADRQRLREDADKAQGDKAEATEADAEPPQGDVQAKDKEEAGKGKGAKRSKG